MQGTEQEIESTVGSVWQTILPQLAIFMVITWLILMFYAFWWFEYRLLQPFAPGVNSQTVFFDGEQGMQRLADQIAIEIEDKQLQNSLATVVHFWDPDCPCNRLNESHVKKIIQDYGDMGVNFVIATRDKSGLREARQRFTHPAVIHYQANLPAEFSPPSSPAAVVVNRQGEASYFGPYSVGALCLSDNGNFVETILDSLLQGKNRMQINTAAIGCFCDWSVRT